MIISQFCIDVADYWWEEKWGRCHQAPFLQRLKSRGRRGESREERMLKVAEIYAERFCASGSSPPA